MDNTVDSKVIAARLEKLVAMVNGGPASIPVRFGFLLGELQGLAISLRHGGTGIGEPEDRAHLLVPAEVR